MGSWHTICIKFNKFTRGGHTRSAKTSTTSNIKVNISAASCEMRTRQGDVGVVVCVCFVRSMCVGVQKQQER